MESHRFVPPQLFHGYPILLASLKKALPWAPQLRAAALTSAAKAWVGGLAFVLFATLAEASKFHSDCCISSIMALPLVPAESDLEADENVKISFECRCLGSSRFHFQFSILCVCLLLWVFLLSEPCPLYRRLPLALKYPVRCLKIRQGEFKLSDNVTVPVYVCSNGDSQCYWAAVKVQSE